MECNALIDLRGPARRERRRGFQPPWYTVLIFTCEHGHTTTVRQSWSGGAPAGAIRCGAVTS